MNLSLADLWPVWLDLAVLALILVVFLWDAFTVEPDRKPVLGYLTAGSLALLVGLSFLWPPEGDAFLGVYHGDYWALFLKRLLLAVGAVAALGSIDHVRQSMPRRQGEYYLLLLFSLLGMTLLVGAQDLVLLAICFELMGIPLFVLTALQKHDRREGRFSFPAEAGMKFFIVGVISTPIALFGLSFIVGFTGSSAVPDLVHAPLNPLMKLGFLMLLAGMGFKIGMVPFHMWVPDTYQAAPTPFVAFLSTAPKIAGIAALARIFLGGIPHWGYRWIPVILVLCLASLTLGNFWALTQANTKRLLAYSGIGHIGYLLMAFVCISEMGIASLLFYLVAYALTNLGVFLVAEAVASVPGDDTVADFEGLAQRAPALALAMLLFLLSLAGIPFVVGFWAKLYVFIWAWQAGFEWLVVAGGLLAIVALFYYLQLARAMYMTPAKDSTRLSLHPALIGAIFLCLVGAIGFGVAPAWLLTDAQRASADLLKTAGPMGFASAP